MKKLRILIALISATLLTGCIKEELDNCDVTHYITLEYTKNTESIDKLPQVIASIDIYAFDSNGRFVKHFADEGLRLRNNAYKIPISLPTGEYTFVAWVGTREDYEISDESTSGNPITLANARLKVAGDSTNQVFNDLFHGAAQHIQITNIQNQYTHISLTKNTNTVNVTIKGLENVASIGSYSDIDVLFQVANSKYKFDNTISNPEKVVSYSPTSREVANGDLTLSFKTYRLLNGLNSHLIINDANSNQLFSKNLIELLLLLPKIQSDHDFDIYDTYNIEIIIDTNLSISVIINGYTVISSDQEIQ